MGSNTSTNTDTNNIYTEQQYVETMEDKYAELLRQNELLRQENEKAKEDNQKLKEENELLKSGNYNLKRDNDNLRGDIYNLRLENSKMTEDNTNLTTDNTNLTTDNTNLISKIQNLEKDKEQLERIWRSRYDRLVQKLESNSRLLPKVAEKDDHRQFMLDCVIPLQNTAEDRIKGTALIEKIIHGDDYIIHRSKNNNLLITNTGKIFQSQRIGFPGQDRWFYIDLKIREMTKEIMDVIIYAMRIEYGHNGYVNSCPLITLNGKHKI